MDSESAKTEAVGAGPDMRKTLASVIITEKATAEPCVVMNALIRCLQVPEVGPLALSRSLEPSGCGRLCVHPPLSTQVQG